MAAIGSGIGAAAAMALGIPPQFGAAGGSAIEDSFFGKKKKKQDDGGAAAFDAVMNQQANQRYGGVIGMPQGSYGDPGMGGDDMGMGMGMGGGEMDIISMLLGSMGGATGEEEDELKIPEREAYVPPTLTGLSKSSPHGIAIQQALNGMRGF